MSLDRLRTIVGALDSVVIGYSGGVDSAFLAKVCHDVLGPRAVAVTAVSPSLGTRDRERAETVAREIGIPHRLVETREVEDPRYAANDGHRCYFCKAELFTLLEAERSSRGFAAVAYGANLDDTGDYRPGMRAAAEAAVRAPLVEAALTKAYVRRLARELGLSIWEAPAQPCLASRFPYGVTVTVEGLEKVERAENLLRDLGFTSFRVRYHEQIARIELPVDQLEKALDPPVRARIVEGFRAIGFAYATLDLEGFVSGKLNRALES